MHKIILPISFTVIFTIGLLFAGFLGKKLRQHEPLPNRWTEKAVL
jgi:hypothetical protein